MAATATIHHGVRNVSDIMSVRGKRRMVKTMTAIGVFFARLGCFLLIVILLPAEVLLVLLLAYGVYAAWHTADMLVG